jgi:hypothetical protein
MKAEKDDQLQKEWEAWRDAMVSTFPLDDSHPDEEERLRAAFDEARRRALGEVIHYVDKYEDSVIGKTLREIWDVDP